MKTIKLLSMMLLLATPSMAFADFIDFEDLSNGDVVTNQYSGVVFSSTPGFDNMITTQPGIGFGDNFICTGPTGGSINCTQETILTFAGLANDLTFWQVGDNDVGVVALVDVFVNGMFAATVDILGFDDFNTPDLVDLSSFTDVSSIRIYNVTDGGGLGWDNFEFSLGSVAVAEPGMLSLFALGILGVVMARRK